MPARASHIPSHPERIILQALQERGELKRTQLRYAGVTIDKLIAKEWIEATKPGTYRITAAGTAAMTAKILSKT